MFWLCCLFLVWTYHRSSYRCWRYRLALRPLCTTKTEMWLICETANKDDSLYTWQVFIYRINIFVIRFINLNDFAWRHENYDVWSCVVSDDLNSQQPKINDTCSNSFNIYMFQNKTKQKRSYSFFLSMQSAEKPEKTREQLTGQKISVLLYGIFLNMAYELKMFQLLLFWCSKQELLKYLTSILFLPYTKDTLRAVMYLTRRRNYELIILQKTNQHFFFITYPFFLYFCFQFTIFILFSVIFF